MANDNTSRLVTAYTQVCDGYRAIDDIRMKLLALLPLATGTGILVLLGDGGKTTSTYGGGVGAFGVVATAALFVYELHGIEKCHYLIETGKCIEKQLGVPAVFTHRPKAALKILNEPLAAAIIYPASLTGWAYLAIQGAEETSGWRRNQGWAVAGVFFVSVAGALLIMNVVERHRSKIKCPPSKAVGDEFSSQTTAG
jgi:hypothetical protein